MTGPEPDKTPAELNPYAPPEATIGEVSSTASGDLTEAEAIRRKYLSHEASVKSIGSLHYLAAVLSVFSAFVVTFPTARQPGGSFVAGLGLPLTFLALIAFHVALGVGLTRLKTWARWVEAVLVGLGGFWTLALLGLSVSRSGGDVLPMVIVTGVTGLILGYVLYLLLSKKGTFVFSPKYQEVIAQTPHVKYRTSCLVWFVVVVFLAFCALAIVGVVIRSRG
jgi:hypothetical protein